ncbi:MAG: hypothetical protein PHS44_04780 [Candidatus Dojkabacteria bacterium]|jgi:hypothetical protein|nr:hypothetical protein [Candidatus Dojkabacteria bacterium]
MGELRYGSVSTADDLIWIDFGTNLSEGGRVFVRDTYAGLYSASAMYTLNSSNADLDSVPGYGLQKYSISEEYLGPFVTEADYANSGNVVGGITNLVYGKSIFHTSSSPIYKGRASLYVKARPDEDTPLGTDYTDTIILTITGNI